MNKELQKSGEQQAREPPKLMRYLVWCSGGKLKDDALVAFDELFASAVDEFGRGYALVWGSSQCLRSIPRVIWSLIVKAVTD